MTTRHTLSTKFATLFAGFLSIALLICANTTSTCILHQKKAPVSLDKYRKLK